MTLYIDANGNLTCIPPRSSKLNPDEKNKKSLDKAQNLCYNKDTKGEGEATRE